MIMRPNASGDWTEVKCDWFQTIIDNQNRVYWVNYSGGTTIIILYCIICTFGALANLMVLFVFLRTAKLRNLRNSFIVNLAASDLLLCVITAPVTLYSTVNLYWPFGNLPCKLMASVQAVNTFVSSLTLALIAMDRVLLTLCPIRWRLAATAPILCYCTVWILSIVIAFPYSLAVRTQIMNTYDPWDDRQTPAMLEICELSSPEVCVEMESAWQDALFSKTTFTMIVFAIQYLLPLGALAYAYIHIGSTIRRRSKLNKTVDTARRITMQTKNRRALFLLFILVLTYAFCWSPSNIYNVLSGFELIEYSQYRYLFCHLIGISSACVNPITYALVNESYRLALHNIISPIKICKDNNASYSTTRPPQRTIVRDGGIRTDFLTNQYQTEREL